MDIYRAKRKWKYAGCIFFLINIVFANHSAFAGTISACRFASRHPIRQPGPPRSHAATSAIACDSFRVDYYSIDASRFPVIFSEVALHNQDDISIGGLTENDFTVYENDVLQSPLRVEPFGSDSGGVTIALLLDKSNSMSRALPAVKSTAIEFVKLMLPDDRMAMASFGKNAQLEQNFTGDKNALTSAINAISLEPYTALYDGVLFGLDLMKSVPGHKAIVLLTDGRDRDSKVGLNDVLSAVSAAGIPIFGIGLGLKPDWGESELRQIAETSGGKYYRSPTTQDLAEIYNTIFFVLHRFWYRITYTASTCAMDGTLRNVRIQARVGNDVCEAANNYTAPDHVVTLAATAAKAPNPGATFDVLLEVPAQSKTLLGMTALRVALNYEKTFLTPAEPHEMNIIPGALPGNPVDFAFSFSVNDNAGQIVLDIQRNNAAGPISGQGALAQIRFLTSNNMPDSTQLRFTLTDLEARDGPRCQIAMQTQNLTLYSDGLLVWPGDTNFNGTVELSDVLVLGLYWALKGPPRPGNEDQLAWMPHLAKKHAILAATHADADGNGGISERDIIPIGLNWAKTQADSYAAHQSRKAVAVLPIGEMKPRIFPTASPGEYILKLVYETRNHAPLTGVTFKLYYPADFTVKEILPGALWPQEPLVFSHTEKTDRLLALGMMLPANVQSPTGSGELVTMRFSANSLPFVDQFRFKDAALVTMNGRVNEIEILPDVRVNQLEVPEKLTLFPAYPNPFNPRTTLHYYLPEESAVTMTIYDLGGRVMGQFVQGFRQSGLQTLAWDGKNKTGRFAGSGVYFIEVVTITKNHKRFVAKQKVTLLK